MRLQLTVSAATGRRSVTSTEVEVEGPQGATAGELAAALAPLVGPSGVTTPAPAVSVHRVPLSADALVGLPPLVDGAAVTLGTAGPTLDRARRAAPRTPVSMAVVHGPDAGRTVELVSGRHTIGRSPEADVQVDDPGLSRVHAELVVSADGVWVRDLGSTNGTVLDGEPVGCEAHRARAGATIAIGASTLVLRTPAAVPAATARRPDGTTVVNRRPRIHEPPPATVIALPTPPDPPRSVRLPWVAMLLPLPFSALLAALFGPSMLVLALMSPVMMAGTSLSDRLGSRRRYAAESAEHERLRSAALVRAEAACAEETRLLRRALPDAAEVLSVASLPTTRIWERRSDDRDAMVVSLGTATRPSAVRVVRPPGDDGPEHLSLHGVPCRVALPEVGTLGVCGPREQVLGVARSLVGQLAALHAPADLTLVLLGSGDRARSAWSWLARLPHTRTPDGRVRAGTAAVRGVSDEALRCTVAALADTVAARTDGRDRTGPWPGPWTLVLLDDARELRGLPRLAEVLDRGPAVGVLCLALAEHPGALPAESGGVLDLAHPGRPRLDLPGSPCSDVVVDRVGPWWAERLSRGLAPLRDATPSTSVASLPVSVDLSTASQADLTCPRVIRDLWGRRPHTTRAPVGVGPDGPLCVDLAADGPHILVGGTTGSGKSELLRTLVASLAAHNRPEHLSFVLVDYKGGAAFRECAVLPHVAGVVTDLDDHLAARALTSLTAELKRRERVLAEAGVQDFVAYQRLSRPASRPLPRLVVLVDEFRALAEELPAFVDGMVRFAALGRSLGVHVVLATQRPSGVVTADIKANVNLRIALRMRDPSESMDVVDSPAAAAIDPAAPGRAFASVAGSEPACFQSAHVASPARRAEPTGLRVRPLPFGESPPPWHDAADEQEEAATELALLVEAVCAAATELGASPSGAAWLPPLPERLSAPARPADAPPGAVVVGLTDLPAQQVQQPLLLDVDAPGHWAFVGTAGTGRTSALLTVAAAATAQHAPSRLHLHALSGGSLAALEGLPHCGAHVPWDDLCRVDRLVARLVDLAAGRRQELAGGGHGSLAAWRAADPAAPPTVLLLVDDWDLLLARADDHVHGQLADRLIGLLREGPAVGVTAVLSGDRSLLVGRAASSVTHRVLLALADRTDALLAGVSPSALPNHQPPGRGVLQDGTEVQLALPGPWTPAHDDPRAVRHRPLLVAPLPTRVLESQLDGATPDTVVALGVGGDEAEVVGLDPVADGRRWLVCGPPGTGVSSTLAVVAGRLALRGWRVIVAARRAPLDALRGQPGLTHLDNPHRVDGLAALRVAGGHATGRVAVVVDDADELLDTPLESALREVASAVESDGGILVCGAATSRLSGHYRGLAVEVARQRTGVLLSPAGVSDGDLFGLRVTPERRTPGRGYLVRRGAAVRLQVAQPAPPPSRGSAS